MLLFTVIYCAECSRQKNINFFSMFAVKKKKKKRPQRVKGTLSKMTSSYKMGQLPTYRQHRELKICQDWHYWLFPMCVYHKGGCKLLRLFNNGILGGRFEFCCCIMSFCWWCNLLSVPLIVQLCAPLSGTYSVETEEFLQPSTFSGFWL